jgi:hypothetical protein
MVLQQWGFFETNLRLRKLPSAFLFSHSFIPCSFSSWLLNRFFFRKCLAPQLRRFTRFTENFPEIQFNHRVLAYLVELLSPHFEARLSAFHTSPFVQISLADRRFGGLKKYSVRSRCFLCLCPFAIRQLEIIYKILLLCMQLAISLFHT